jgi:hypothetical protein
MQLSMAEIQTIINEIESQENRDRKNKEIRSYEVMEGALKKYVGDKIRCMYPKTWDTYTIADYSLLKKIVDKKAKAYKELPVRALEGDEENEAYQTIAKDDGLNQAMAKLDKLYCQHKYALIGVFMNFDEAGQPDFQFMPLAPYEFDCVKDASGNLKVVILSYPDSSMVVEKDSDGVDTIIAGRKLDEGTSRRVYTFWTDTNHYMIQVTRDKEGRTMGAPEIVPIPENPDNVNPWGVLPFVYIPKSDTANYPIASPLADQTIEVNSLLSVYLTSGNMQIGQFVLKYPQGQEFQVVSSGLMTGIRLPQSTDPDAPETDASYISPSPNMDGHRTSIVTFLNLILEENGIRAASGTDISSEKFASGVDRAISESDVQDCIESNQALYYCVENEVYKIVKAQLQSININVLTSENVTVIYKKPKMLITDTERLNNLKQAIDMGLLEEWEKFVVYDPNLSEDDAKAKLERINGQNEKRMARAVSALGGVMDADQPGESNQVN